MDASEMKEKIGRFRILIIGRASAGKTSILQRFCNTSDSPEIFNSAGEKIDDTVLGASRGRGGNDIKNETVFQINPGFVFHDSRGFEAGGESEFNNVKEFIEDRSKQPDIKDRIHTIWYCIPMDEESRSFTQAEIKFFSHCNTGSIPVVVLFTKFDALYDVEFARLQKQGNSRTVAKELTPKNVEEQFSNGSQLKFLYNSKDIQRPPNCHVCLADMDKKDADCGPLIERTAGTLKNEVLQQLFVSTQQTNLELCMKYAVERELAGLVASEEEISYEDTIARSSCWFPLIQLDRAHREEMQSKILAVVSGSSPLEKTSSAIFRIRSLILLFLTLSSSIWRLRKQLLSGKL
ncbi:hypothetical protein DEU56DRAFT_598052 [Suillus clintonianus]|uniref:uncharacterized protein n=1 Tax=Suillus clintonianus TaxID=1904413 RepID=UPI001B886AA1|nr:uncharacterized protein DEU56DRAFT_598052 [Suillus clintonianus]KAG2124235.1 hypothetical protein DEU56DRAFT_598052 [Suillus clintonianus]